MAYFMDKVTSTLTELGKNFDIVNNFQKLKTDQDRIIFALNILWEHNLILNQTNNLKNAKKSEELREQGNAIFVTCGSKISLYYKARKLYTESISLAPYPSKQLALAYANRSAVLLNLDYHSECVEDIDRALALNYPDDQKAKLYIRKMQCSIVLGNSIAKNMIKETEYWISKMTSSVNKLKLQTKLDELRQKVEQKNDQYNPIKPNEVGNEPLPVIKSYSNEIPCASDAISLKYDEHNGRHIVATRNIDAGEIIVTEKCYSSMLLQSNLMSHCSNCLKVYLATIPCKYCTYAMYCSEQCRDIEWKKCHDVECAIFSIMVTEQFFPNDFLSLRILVCAIKEAGNIQELRTMLEEANKSNVPRTMGFSPDGKFHSGKYISLYSLMRNTKKRSFADLFTASVHVCFTLYLLAQHTKIFGSKLLGNFKVLAENDNVTFLGSLILRHQQIISTNAHTFYEERNSSSEELGNAILSFCSLFNHSCSPNIIRVSKSHDIVLYTLYPIQKGKQILDNYGSYFAMEPKIVRQDMLLKGYHFICKCIPCQEDWPIYSNLKSFETLAIPMNDKNMIRSVLMKVNMYRAMIKKGDVLNNPYIIKDLITMIRIMYDRMPIACYEMINVVEILKQVYALHGNTFILPTQSQDK
ncbi:SET and MYND domain-containing protein 4 [Harpegnathos saltator]|uniref:SET and MYND domain-containing protein 4 n=1 Tax=Harpegnathos saltator TaxID=610380 RepID=UPI000DBED312|nr:SET and MYND domain-containing protein 4 [Harpegnathos saltator]XP_019698180.2 SET and MYND domain-containing protein 4 [Harpegnathos saltator]